MTSTLRQTCARLQGHAWTLGPTIRDVISPPPVPSRAQPFQTSFYDAWAGEVRLTGSFLDAPDSDNLLVILHGLGGSACSPYVVNAAAAAKRAGVASLCLSMRGAERSGEDILHGGLTEDLWIALKSPELQRFKRVHLLGFSVGGHIAIKAALDGVDRRLQSVAAICSPLDLDAATIAFDHPSQWLYRRHILASLNRNYEAVSGKLSFLPSARMVKAARSCRERDSLTVVPRFGFRNVEDYYKSESVSRRLHKLDTATLLVASRHDPIIPAATLEPAIRQASDALTVRWMETGGHVYFPADLNLNCPGRPGLAPQVIQWLLCQ